MTRGVRDRASMANRVEIDIASPQYEAVADTCPCDVRRLVYNSARAPSIESRTSAGAKNRNTRRANRGGRMPSAVTAASTTQDRALATFARTPVAILAARAGRSA
jgi:hypothetical protein